MATIYRRTKEKIDKCAEIMVHMERGEWVYEDGRPRWATDANGERVPRVVKTDAIKAAWGNVSNCMYHDLFAEDGRWHAYLQERLTFHRMRLSGGYQKALAALTDDGNALKLMSDRLYESLWNDLNDPERARQIPFRERAKLFEVLVKMEAQVKGDMATKAPERLNPTVIVQQLNVPESVRRNLLAEIVEEDPDDIEGRMLPAPEEE